MVPSTRQMPSSLLKSSKEINVIYVCVILIYKIDCFRLLCLVSYLAVDYGKCIYFAGTLFVFSSEGSISGIFYLKSKTTSGPMPGYRPEYPTTESLIQSDCRKHRFLVKVVAQSPARRGMSSEFAKKMKLFYARVECCVYT